MTSTDHVRQPAQEGHAAGGRGGHGWMMIACCIPVLVIAVVLAATGAASVGFLLVALMCTAMMAMMMRGMNRGDRDRAPASQEARR
jgi:Flp pilus assembly protein TadB